VWSHDTELSEDGGVASLSIGCDILSVFSLSTYWDSVGFTTKSLSNVTSLLKMIFLSFKSQILYPFTPFFETHKHIFPPFRTQLVFLDIVIGRTIKYPKRVIVLTNLSWLNFQRSFISYHKRRKPINEIASIRNCLSPKKYIDIQRWIKCNEPFLARACSFFRPPYFIAVSLSLWSVFPCSHHDIAVEKGTSVLTTIVWTEYWSSFPCSFPYSFCTSQRTLRLFLCISCYIHNIA